MSGCRPCGGECVGPCYDLCACRHCWNGWTDVPFLTRLRWRVNYVKRDVLRRLRSCGR